MKRKALALTLILGIVIATLNVYMTGVQAQDYYDRYKPTMTPPSILVTSPQNYSISSTNSLSLVFNVSKPQIIELSPDVNYNSSRLFRVSYRGDWQTEEQLLYIYQYEPLDFLEFNTILSDVPDGTHELQIIAVGAVDITVAMFGFTYHTDANTSIVFTVNSIQPTPSPEPTSTPTSTPYQEPQQTEQLEIIIGMAIVVTVFAAGLGLLIYLIKRK